jgi:hypothetical protein
MATIKLKFNNNINVTLQANTGDIVYFKKISDGKTYKLGECTGIDLSVSPNEISVEVAASVLRPVAGDFIFFAKDPEISTSGIIGYYGETKMENTATTKQELFAVSTEYFISS